jgi:hypothetical protein
MTDQQHPITPPPELVQQWLSEYFGTTVTGEVSAVEQHIATQAAQWGADQELEACYEWVVCDWTDIQSADRLVAARRPTSPSLKEQALAALQEAAYMADDSPPQGICSDQIDIIRRALEQLDD